MKQISPLLALLLPALLLAGPRRSGTGDRMQVLRGIVVATGEKAADVTCFFCSVSASGEVSGDISVLDGGIEINGPLAGDAVAIGGSIHLGPKTKMAGDAVAIGGSVTRDPRAMLAGDEVSKPRLFLPGQREFAPAGMLIFATVQIGLLFLCALMLRAPRVQNLSVATRERWGRGLLAGLLLLIAYFFVSFQATGLPNPAIGPVETLLSLAFLATVLLGMTGLCFAIGSRLAPASSAAAIVLTGAAILTVTELVPLLGFVVLFAALILGGGVALVGRFGGRKPAAEASVAPAS